MLNYFKERFRLIQALVKNPGATGTVLPSSKYLSKAMAKPIEQLNKNDLVIELGGGTGVITQALLNTHINSDNLYIIEKEAKLANILHKKFPNLHILTTDAAHINEHLDLERQTVGAFVSGLPLRSMPDEVVEQIMQMMRDNLKPGGLYIQFTYDLSDKKEYHPAGFTKSQSTIVWRNVPPARVNVFTKN